MWARVKKAVAEGRFVRGRYVGRVGHQRAGSEAMTVQFVHGKRPTSTSWAFENDDLAPDTFGFAAGLPDHQGGGLQMAAPRRSWSQTNHRAHTFQWEGIGTHIYALPARRHLQLLHAGGSELAHAAKNFKDKGSARHSLAHRLG